MQIYYQKTLQRDFEDGEGLKGLPDEDVDASATRIEQWVFS
jgi:hypothetical protein